MAKSSVYPRYMYALVKDEFFCIGYLSTVLRIPDVYPGSRILIFTHPGSRIQKQQQKRGFKKICCHNFLCSHKFHKIANYFSFGLLKKKIGPIFKEL
jgi:hypothetical protein